MEERRSHTCLHSCCGTHAAGVEAAAFAMLICLLMDVYEMLFINGLRMLACLHIPIKYSMKTSRYCARVDH